MLQFYSVFILETLKFSTDQVRVALTNTGCDKEAEYAKGLIGEQASIPVEGL